MSFANYTNISDALANVTRADKTPFLDDVENYKRSYEKSILQNTGTAIVAAKAIEGVKALRTKLKGIAKSKYGFDDSDLEDIQNSVEEGDLNKTLSTLTDKLSGKLSKALTDKGRNVLSSLKDKLQGLKDESTNANEALANARSKIADIDTDQAATKTVAKPAPAREQIDDSPTINEAESGKDMLAPLNRSTARFNNLDGEAQQRVLDKYNEQAEPQGKLSLNETDEDVLQPFKNNLNLRNNLIRQEEQNPQTTFKDPDLQVNPADDAEYLNKTNPNLTARQTLNPDKFDNAPEEEEVANEAGTFTEDATNLATKAAEAAEVATKVGSGLEEATGTLAGLTEASTALDFSPVGFVLQGVLGIASLFTGLELKAHQRKYETPPSVFKSYAAQADAF